MKALILNSGMGKRMGDLTEEHPKCMTKIDNEETILSRQLKLIQASNIKDVIITTGYFNEILIDYCHSLNLNLDYTFVNNSVYDRTNYIYSIYLARKFLDEKLVLLHGDLVFDTNLLKDLLSLDGSYVTVSSTLDLPEKDFKAVIENGLIKKIGIEFFDKALAAQPFYKLEKIDWNVWLKKIIEFCENGNVTCYAEDALNQVTDKCEIYPFDFKNRLCAEIDTPEDLNIVRNKLI